jgi:hypothetical protein
MATQPCANEFTAAAFPRILALSMAQVGHLAKDIPTSVISCEGKSVLRKVMVTGRPCQLFRAEILL